MITLDYKYQLWHKDLNQKLHVFDIHCPLLIFSNSLGAMVNFPALNASIEAARAGESGKKGLAVVANEIKELAGETAAATGQIKAAIDGIQSQTIETVVDLEEIKTNSVDMCFSGLMHRPRILRSF